MIFHDCQKFPFFLFPIPVYIFFDSVKNYLLYNERMVTYGK